MAKLAALRYERRQLHRVCQFVRLVRPPLVAARLGPRPDRLEAESSPVHQLQSLQG